MKMLSKQYRQRRLKRVFQMYQEGATLGAIGDNLSISRQRVHQLLGGSKRHGFSTTGDVAETLGVSKQKLRSLIYRGLVDPIGSRNGKGSWYFWRMEDVLKVIKLLNRYCAICQKPVPYGRSKYCSEECLQESRKYKYWNPVRKQKQIEATIRYKQNHPEQAKQYDQVAHRNYYLKFREGKG